MAKTDPRVDEYVARAADFAKPVLNHLRKLVHKAAPEIEETMKWSFPHFVQKGTVCSMASFKEHCAFGFWKQSLMEDAAFPAEKTAMGSFGRITSVKDLPDDKTLIAMVKRAVELNENGIKVAKKVTPKKELVVPKDLEKALSLDAAARATFDKFSYSHKKEYVEWIEEAKTEATRQKRLATTIEWLAEGKDRNWKYKNC